jgi:hypothetical protein
VRSSRHGVLVEAACICGALNCASRDIEAMPAVQPCDESDLHVPKDQPYRRYHVTPLVAVRGVYSERQAVYLQVKVRIMPCWVHRQVRLLPGRRPASM